MITDGNLQRKTSHDYISRLRFLSKTYNLDSAITMSYIDEILENESRLLTERDFYNSKHAIGDFQAGLKKFLSFIQSNYQERKEENLLSEIRKIESSGDLTITEKRQLLKARVGQGDFRKHLIEYWQCCSVTGCSRLDCLMASHIKPWRKSNNQERLDVFNGLLLTPNLDKLFATD